MCRSDRSRSSRSHAVICRENNAVTSHRAWLRKCGTRIFPLCVAPLRTGVCAATAALSRPFSLAGKATLSHKQQRAGVLSRLATRTAGDSLLEAASSKRPVKKSFTAGRPQRSREGYSHRGGRDTEVARRGRSRCATPAPVSARGCYCFVFQRTAGTCQLRPGSA